MACKAYWLLRVRWLVLGVFAADSMYIPSPAKIGQKGAVHGWFFASMVASIATFPESGLKSSFSPIDAIFGAADLNSLHRNIRIFPLGQVDDTRTSILPAWCQYGKSSISVRSSPVGLCQLHVATRRYKPPSQSMERFRMVTSFREPQTVIILLLHHLDRPPRRPINPTNRPADAIPGLRSVADDFK